jgi:hypothetical protein
MNMFGREKFTDINVNVTEKRAPTDESVRLLREMEKEALNKIVKNIDLSNNQFSARLLVFKDLLNLNTKGKVLFSLNGKRHELNVEFGFLELEVDMIKLCYDELAKYVAREILMTVSKLQTDTYYL